MNIGKFSFFRKGIKNKKPALDVTLEQALNKIKAPEQKEDIEKIRATTDKAVRKVLKNNLDYFTFSGSFKERTEQGLIQHSNIMCIDFDLNGWKKVKQEDNTVVEVFETSFNIAEIKERLSADLYTLAVFVSPSGDGLKVLVKIDGTEHFASFKWLENYYAERFQLEVDPSGKDIPRACFISYDEDPFVNMDSAVCPVVALSEKTQNSEPRPTNPAKHLPQELREHVKIDTDTGEIIDLNDLTKWTREQAEGLVKAQVISERIFTKQRDITASYDDWQNITFALATFKEHGRAIFHKVSQFNEAYDQKEADKKFTNALTTGTKFTNAAFFFKIAKTYGIDTKVVQTIAVGIAEGADGASYQDFKIDLPQGCIMSPELREHIFTYSFVEHNNQYWYGRFDNVKRTVDFHPISNFVIHPLFLIRSRSEPVRIVEIKNMYGRSQVLDIKTEAFVSPQMLYACFEATGNYLFDGDRKQLQKIKSKLYNFSKDALPMSVLGWHKDGFYAFANGIYTPQGFVPTDDYGIVEHEHNQYFIPALSSIYKDEEEDYEAQKKFVFIKNKITFKEWSEWFLKVHGDNGAVTLCFYLTSLFRDIVYDRFKFFPHLFGFGPPGTGKSAMAWSLTQMFGQAQIPFNLNSGTKVAFHKTFAMFRNAVVWFDEYKNSIDPQRIEAIKSAYDGAGHQKSEMTQANRTKSTPVYSSAVFTGQELPTADNALFKRVLLLEYHVTHRTEEERLNLDKFREMETRGLSHITAHLTTLRPIFESNYEAVYQSTVKDLQKELGDRYANIEARIVLNYAIILAGYRTIEIPLNLSMPIPYSTMLKLCAERIDTQNKLIGNSKETSVFWDLVQYLLSCRMIKNKEDFKVEIKHVLKINPGAGTDTIERTFVDPKTNDRESRRVLYLRLSKIHPLYLTEHRKQYSKNGMDKGSIIHYLQHEDSYLGKVNSTRFEGGSTFAYCFDYEMLERAGIKIENEEEGQEQVIPSSVVISEPNEKIQFTQNPNPDSNEDTPF